METREIDVGAVTLTVAEAGAGGRPLLLLHGFTGAKEDFTPWVDRLAGAGWHALAPDHRGHGASAKPAGEAAYSLDLLAADAAALADRRGWDRFALLGHSMGGYVAQLVAIAAPERLTGLVLMDTGHRAPTSIPPDLVEAAGAIARTQGMEALADLLLAAESPLDSPSHRRLVAENPDYAEGDRRKLCATAPDAFVALGRDLTTRPTVLDTLGAMTPVPPTLVMVGEEDAPFLADSRDMAAAIAGAQLAVLPDAGHSPQFENPDAWWAALWGFLSGLPPA